jgi:MoaA/NifB/PqqE/SkfB family radical SAM enzyme
MSGKCGAWKRVVENIRYLSSKVYTTVGIVVTEDNIQELPQTVEFAAALGVSDIRVISAAQYQSTVDALAKIPEDLYSKFPILKYRVNNSSKAIGVRGIKPSDSHHCWIGLDDVAIAGENHFPCIIYFREHGNPRWWAGSGFCCWTVPWW